MGLGHKDRERLQTAINLSQTPDAARATEILEKFLKKHPGNALAVHFLGVAAARQGNHQTAVAQLKKSISMEPQNGHFKRNYATYLMNASRYHDALEFFEICLKQENGNAMWLYGYAASLFQLKRYDEALACYDKALSIEPNFFEALNERGAALGMLRRYQEGLESCKKALSLKPDYAEAHMNLGNALQGLNRYEEAVRQYEKALALDPDYAEAHMNLGNALQGFDRYEEAIEHYDKALALKCDFVEALQNKYMLYLSLGRFAEGWKLYERRWETEKMTIRAYSQPRWNGEPVTGTLLVWAEQGLGDHILYSSMVPELGRYADSVVVEVDPRLVELFTRSFPAVKAVAMREDLYAGPVAAQVPIASLGRFLRPNWDAFPLRERGYLIADQTIAAELRQRLKQDGRKVVGLSWRSVNPRMGKSKSARLSDFETILRLPGCRFVDLQYGDTREEREAIEREFGVRVERLEDIDNMHDIDGLAALITACDLVLTVSNTTAHLAGALGRPTWVLVPFGFAQIWYWFIDRQDSPWYPRAHLRRQKAAQPWAGLITSITGEISDFTAPALTSNLHDVL